MKGKKKQTLIKKYQFFYRGRKIYTAIMKCRVGWFGVVRRPLMQIRYRKSVLSMDLGIPRSLISAEPILS